jgi:hypothetical protein
MSCRWLRHLVQRQMRPARLTQVSNYFRQTDRTIITNGVLPNGLPPLRRRQQIPDTGNTRSTGSATSIVVTLPISLLSVNSPSCNLINPLAIGSPNPSPPWCRISASPNGSQHAVNLIVSDADAVVADDRQQPTRTGKFGSIATHPFSSTEPIALDRMFVNAWAIFSASIQRGRFSLDV